MTRSKRLFWIATATIAIITFTFVTPCLSLAPLPQSRPVRPPIRCFLTKDPTPAINETHVVSQDTNGSQQSRSTIINEPVSSTTSPLQNIPSLPGAERVDGIMKSPLVEVGSSSLVLTSSILVAVATLSSLSNDWKATIDLVENVIAYTFAVEFMVRWYSKWHFGVARFFTKPLVLVDVVVVIFPLVLPMIPGAPAWLTSKSGLITLRLLRILRLQRVLEDLDSFSNFCAALGLTGFRQQDVQLYQLQLARVVLSIFTLLSVSAGLIYTTEHGVNPLIENYFSALYFSLTTLTTVGFGDITPVTTAGKLVVGGSILAGVTIIPAQAALLVEALLDAQSQKQKLLQDNDGDKESSTATTRPMMDDMPTPLLPSSAIDAATPCPSCGATFHWTGARYCWSCGSKLPEQRNDEQS